jgi:ATP synthase A1 C subunit
MDEIDPFMAYMNSRVRGMKSHLLTREQYEQLIEADSENAIADRLLSSPYQHDLAESLTRYQGADAIEDAVSRNLVKTYERLLVVTRGLDQAIGEIFFQRWDLIAVKSLLRAKHHGLDAQSGDAALVPGPGLGVALLHEFASLPSVEALVRALAVWNSSLCRVLVDKLPEYAQSNDLSVLEDALDRNYFLKNLRLLRGDESENAQILKIALQMEIDRINLRTVMALRGSGDMDEAARSRLLPGGRLHEPVIEQMVQAQSPEQVIESLANTPYSEMRKGLYKFIQSNRFSQLERIFEHAFIAQLSRLSRTRGMSIAILLLYTWLKFNEVINLRVIARGGAKHLPKGLVREEIMYV